MTRKPDKPETEQREEDNFFLPDFCSVRMVFAVVIIAELLAIVLTLAPLDRGPYRWEDLSIISLFIQWVALISAGVLCLARPWLSRLSDTLASTTSYFLLLGTTTVVSEVTYWTARRITGTVNSLGWHVDFLISNLGISAIVSAILLRFFYVQFQRDRSLRARSDARLQALQARIRPHFLFNSLNTIASLTRSQPDVAEEATEDLADLFRSSLADSNYEVRLKDEWDLARRYLHIEKLRLRDRLQVNWSIDTLPEDALIPQLTIQPLLENAIYHGLEHLPQGGTIMIEGTIEGSVAGSHAGATQDGAQNAIGANNGANAEGAGNTSATQQTTRGSRGTKKDRCITISITNPMPEYSRANQRAGNKMAQENVRLRLEALYEGQGKLTVERKGNVYRTIIRFPYLKQRLKDRQ